jgi:zinc protease
MTPVSMAGARVEEHALANGMKVLIAERHGDPVVAIVLAYKVGARNETERESGLSHFLEHMMFKGCAKLAKGEVDRLTAELGGQNNAFTSYDHTAYWFEFAADRWETALDIEAERMSSLAIDAGEFTAEREVVLEELSMGEDDPWSQLAKRVEGALFPRHQYGRPVIGYVDTLRGLAPSDMRHYYRRFYHPSNATLVVCGDVDPAKALGAIRARFDGIEAGVPYTQADCFRGALAEPLGETRVQMRWDDEGKRLAMAWPSAKVGSADDHALDVALAVLASGRLSRLQRRLVLDRSLATSVSISNDARIEGGVFWLFAECAQGVEPAALERAVDAELGRLAGELVSAKELARAKAILCASEAYDSEAVSDVAEELAEYACDADWRMAFDGGAAIRAVTAKGLRETVARLLTSERRVVGWCLPEAKRAARSTGRSRKAVAPPRQRGRAAARAPSKPKAGAKKARR